jgi:aspartate/tyrosine/aromatic aminotransferase
MVSATSFGDDVIAEAQKLLESGLDPNQIAGVLCKKDPLGKNYGIGILLGQDGKPLPTSLTLLEYVEKELRESGTGNYLNSEALKNEMREATLRWQGVPEALWPNFQLLLPSDAGTGAVQTAIQVATLLNEKFSTLAVEELGWPAYKALAASARLRFQEFATDGAAQGDGVLPLYQAGPLNTTGRVPSAEIVKARAQAAKAAGTPVVLDRAYSGFEFARRLGETPYAEIMRKSFQAQIQPFIDAAIPFAVAISPTKAFVTFALRPCGLLLVFHPDKAKAQALAPKLAGTIRARGSSFEHPVTRAFVKAMVHDRARLEEEHAQALRRNAEAEKQWQALAGGTAIEALFSESYAGLFRNPKAKPEAPREIYGAHLYPVFAEGRCRLNVTGLPSEPAQAADQVSFFAKYCY